MTIAELSRNLHKVVRYINYSAYIDGNFLLDDLVAYKTKDIVKYKCKLLDLATGNSIIICRPEEIHLI